MAIFDPHRKKWRASITIGKKRYQKRGFLSKKAALAFERKIQYEQERNILGMPSSRQDCKITELVSKYLEVAHEFKREKTWKRERASLNVWLEFFQNASYCNEIGNCLPAFLEWRKEKKTKRGIVSNRTINLDIETMKRCFTWGIEQEMISINPIEKAKKYRQNRPGIPRYLTIAEIDIIENAARSDRHKTLFYEIFAVLVRTGMRSGELCSLKKSDIDFQKSLIRIRGEISKNHQERLVPMCQVVFKIISELCFERNDYDVVFCTRTKSPQTPRHINYRFRHLLEKLEKEKKISNTSTINVHTLRKTFISHAVMNGTPIAKVMEIVGHHDYSTMKRYLVISPEYLKENDILPF